MLALLLIKVHIMLHRQCSKNSRRYEISFTFMTQFPQWYHVRGKPSPDILTYLLVQHLLCLTDVHRGDTHSMVWRGTQLHTVFGTSPGQRHHGGGHV